MVSGWRRVFCTSVPKEEYEKRRHEEGGSHSRFGFFSNPSTPRFLRQFQGDPSSSPSLRCRTIRTATSEAQTPTSSAANSPRSSAQATPRSLNSPMLSSPRSPSAFSLIKSTLRLSRSRCGICGENAKLGDGSATFTAECDHIFHFNCVVSHVKTAERNHSDLPGCPVCGSPWREPPILSSTTTATARTPERKELGRREDHSKKHFRVYDDDEPLVSPSPGSLFVPIPENDAAEHDEDDDNDSVIVEEECKKINGGNSMLLKPKPPKTPPEVAILPQSAIISVGRTHETRAVVLKVKAPRLTEFSPHWSNRHSPVDLVGLLDLSDGSSICRIKFAMGILISSLGPMDRLSIVAFSGSSKRLLALRRMTSSGRRAARRIVDMLSSSGQGMSVGDALKKAAKVIGDRRERNPCAGIVVITPVPGDDCEVVTTTRMSGIQTPIHWLSLGDGDAAALSRCVNTILTIALQDVMLQLQLAPTSSPGELTAVYPLRDRPSVFGAGSVRVGNMHGGEEREFLTELKVPRARNGDSHVVLVRASYKDPFSHLESVSCIEQAFLVPRPESARSVVPGIQRLRNIHVTTRAIAESRRLMDLDGDVSGAYHLLTSARALMMQSGDDTARDCLLNLDAEIAELHRRWRKPDIGGMREAAANKEELITPTSAWRAAEKLAKVAVMRKHMNRVSDLHGFENARF